MGAHERGGGDGKLEGIKVGQARLECILVEGRRGGEDASGTEEGEKRPDHQWELMKGGGGNGKLEGIKVGQARLECILVEGRRGGEDVSGTEEGENRVDHQWGLMKGGGGKGGGNIRD